MLPNFSIYVMVFIWLVRILKNAVEGGWISDPSSWEKNFSRLDISTAFSTIINYGKSRKNIGKNAE